MIVGFFRDPVTFGSLQNGGGLTPVIHGLMAAAVQSLPAKNTPNDAQKIAGADHISLNDVNCHVSFFHIFS